MIDVVRIEGLPLGTVAVIDRNGEMFPVPIEVSRALKLFLENNQSGSVVVHFKSGGVAGVETNTRQVLK
jgi:hypothetical protein